MNRALTDFPTTEKELKDAFPLYKGNLSDLAKIASDPTISIVITGPTGTGKTYSARHIHALSGRIKEFRRINCSNIGADLFESEMFGHERGAYTGAVRTTTGLVTAADGGTLFIDEIGDIPMVSQGKLLMFLENFEYMKVGSTVIDRADVRVIAATNKNLRREIKKGKFREDLYYRLNGYPVEMAPLSARPHVIPAITTDLLKRIGAEKKQPVKTLSADAIKAVCENAWPGNIRELEKSCVLHGF
jgi:transcriptional regulator with PAS, ATPase and Fis domain